MSDLLLHIRVAGVVMAMIIAANFVLHRWIPLKDNLPRVEPIVRQIFLVHWFYILFVLAVFAGACLLFAEELAGGSPLGRFLSGSLSLFWLVRVGLQLFYYDRETRRRHRALDALYILSIAYLAGVFGLAALTAR